MEEEHEEMERKYREIGSDSSKRSMLEKTLLDKDLIFDQSMVFLRQVHLLNILPTFII